MLTILSPSKSQDFSKLEKKFDFKQPVFKDEIKNIINILKDYTSQDFEKIMKISEKLANEVAGKYNNFNVNNYNLESSKVSIFSFTGDVYKSLDAGTLTEENINFAQQNLLIISGLYGIIRPLDLIQAYRLEMGTKIKIDNFILYKFWQPIITNYLNEVLQEHNNKTLINLASKEYSQAIDKKKLVANWLDIDFKENKNGTFKTIGIYAKKARGLMARYIIQNNINDVEFIKKFNLDGYKFNSDLSRDNYFCFIR